jgi:poly(3-hydroxybutyrate) depolymerase
MSIGQVIRVGQVGQVGQTWRVKTGLILSILCILRGGELAAATTCSGTPGPGGTVDLKMGALTRPFTVRLPAAYDGRTPGPVVFLFHPGGMNAQYMQGRVPVVRVWPEAIAVYPNALPRTGGAGGFQPGWQNRPGDSGDRDLAYFDGMLDWLRANHCFDEKQVFVMGYSNGAGLSSVLACARATTIAGVAVASGGLSCTLPEPRPIILSHGLRDATIPYQRGVDAAAAWATRNGCSAPPKSGMPGCFAAESCSAAPVVLCTFDGGHEYHEPFTKVFADFLKMPRR